MPFFPSVLLEEALCMTKLGRGRKGKKLASQKAKIKNSFSSSLSLRKLRKCLIFLVAHQQGHVMAVCVEGCAGRALKLSQLDQGARVSGWQKTVSCVNSAHPWLIQLPRQSCNGNMLLIQVLGCRVCPARVPVRDGNSESTHGSCTQEELLHTVTEQKWEGWGVSGRETMGTAPWLPWVGKTGHVL